MVGRKEGIREGRRTRRRGKGEECSERRRGRAGAGCEGYGSRGRAEGESETSPPLQAEDNFSPAQHRLCVRSVSQPFASYLEGMPAKSNGHFRCLGGTS